MVETRTEEKPYTYYCLEPDMNKNMKQFLNFEKIKEELGKPSIYNNAIVKIKNEDEQEVKNFLVNHNYYSFSIYKKQLPIRENSIFDFKDCLEIYEFDSILRNNLQKFTGDIENLVKASLINSLCSHYEGELQVGECYLDFSIYSNSENAQEMIKTFGKRTYSSAQSLPIKHHIKNKEGYLPLWVIVPELTFRETTHFISLLHEEYRKKWIHDLFLTKEYYAKEVALYPHIISSATSWIRAGWFIRNRSAHYGRIYGLPFQIVPPTFYAPTIRKLKALKLKKKDDNKDLFAFMLSIKQVLLCHDSIVQHEWDIFIDEIHSKLEGSEILSPDKMGFPDNYCRFLLINEKPINEKQSIKLQACFTWKND